MTEKREIEKVLVLSTAHLTEPLVWYLRASYLRGGHVDEPVVYEMEHGFFVHVDTTLASTAESFACMKEAAAVAKTEGCVWLLYDRDGALYNDLPTYKW